MKLIVFFLVIFWILARGFVVPGLFFLSQFGQILSFVFFGIPDKLLVFQFIFGLVNQSLKPVSGLGKISFFFFSLLIIFEHLFCSLV